MTLEERRAICDMIRYWLEPAGERCQDHGLAHAVCKRAKESGYEKGQVIEWARLFDPSSPTP